MINQDKYRRLLFGGIFGIALLCLCCKAKVKTQQMPPEEKSAFFTLRLSSDSVQHRTVATLVNVNVVNVKIRYQPDEAKAREPDFLRIEVLYQNNSVVRALTEHPLRKRVDLYSESGQIESKLISLPQGEVVFRVPYFEAYKKITIIETVNRKESAPIILKHEK